MTLSPPRDWITAIWLLGSAVVLLAFLTNPYLGLLGALGSVLVVIAVVRPWAFLPVVLAAILLESQLAMSSLAIPVTAGKVTMVVLLGVWTIHCIIFQLAPVHISPVALAFGGGLTTMVVSLFGAEFTPRMVTLVFVSYVSLAVTALVLEAATERADFAWLSQALALVVTTLLMGHLAAGGVVDSSIGERIGGGSGDANFWAATALVLAPALLGFLASDRRPLPTLLLLAVFAVFPVVVLQTLSRSGAISLVLILPGLAFLLRHRWPILLAGAAVGMAAALVIVNPEALLDRLDSFVDPSAAEVDGSVQDRMTLAVVGLELFQNHWINGVGVSQFRLEAMMLSSGSTRMVAHNTFLNVAAEQGVLGLFSHALIVLAYASRIYKLWIHSVRDSAEAQVAAGLAISLAAMLLMSTTIDLIALAAWYFIMGIGLGYIRQREGQHVA